MKNAGIAQSVEHNLAKVGVASSNLVSRSNDSFFRVGYQGELTHYKHNTAGWQSGYAAVCKAVYAGSSPAPAFLLSGCFCLTPMPGWRNW